MEYFRRNWRWLLFEASVLLTLGALILLAPRWCQQFVAGAWLSFVGWLIWSQIVTDSGSVGPEQGALAEERTARALKELSTRGWRVLSHLELRAFGDIDHVAIGPGGVLIVETKWRSDEQGFGANLEWLNVSRLQRAARDVDHMLRARLQSAPVRRVVVLWGPVALDAGVSEHVSQDVAVVSGLVFSDWLDSIPDGGLDPRMVSDAFDTLESQVKRRDAWDLRLEGPAPRGVQSWLIEGALAVLCGLAGALTTIYALRLFGAWWFWPIGIGLVVLGWIGRRLSRLRLLALGWFVGTGFCFALLVGAYGYFGLRWLL